MGLQESHYVNCGFLGLSNPVITALLLKVNHGYVDKSDDPGKLVIIVNQVVERLVNLMPSPQQQLAFAEQLEARADQLEFKPG